MKFNLTTVFGCSLQLSVCDYDKDTKVITFVGLNLIKQGV